MRIAALALLLSIATFIPAQSQTTHADITARLMDRPLYLRGFWRGDKLHFDSAGHLKGDSKPESFTLSGFDFVRAFVDGNKLVLQGRRMGVEFRDGEAVRVPLEAKDIKHHKDVPVHIEIARSANGDYGPALDAIFADGLTELAPSLQSFWKYCATNGFSNDCKAADLPGYTKPGKKPDGLVSPPKLVHRKDPEYSAAARRLRYEGDGIYRLYVEPDGTVSNVFVVRPIGLGLDEESIAAVKQYSFAPATKNGEPVSCFIKVQVSYRIY